LLEFFLPPKEVRREIMKNIYTIELSILNIFKTLLDYKVKELEKRLEEREEGFKKGKGQENTSRVKVSLSTPS
jgi:mRNA-degrading endonuclease RelE of RelBE toxin-antitoxin system